MSTRDMKCLYRDIQEQFSEGSLRGPSSFVLGRTRRAPFGHNYLARMDVSCHVSLSSAVFIGALIATMAMGSMALVQDPNNPTVPHNAGASLGSVSVANQVDHLELSLSLNATSIRPGQSVNVSLGEWNQLAQLNNVTAESDWALRGLSLGPCGTINYPMGIALFSGHYTASNISSATPLQLDAPGVYSCPMIMSVHDYSFHPLSSTADVYGSCTPGYCFTMKVASTNSVSGYWSGGSSPDGGFRALPQGAYTVAAGDEWGSLALLHFTVE